MDLTEIRRARPLLGTLVEIHAKADFHARFLNSAIDAAFAEVATVHRLMSVHDAHSEASRMNREAHRRTLILSVSTTMVLQAALAMSEASDGAFDLVVGVHLQRLGLLPPTETGAADPLADWRDIEFSGHDRTVRFRRPLRLDFGGIAKGYAVDRAIAALREAGVAGAMVNAGGDLRVIGAEPRTIRLRDPRDPAVSTQSLVLTERALATSAAYFSRADRTDDDEVSALIEPCSGRPYLGGDSISVTAPTCMVADALTKVVLFAAADRTERLLEKYDARAFVQRPEYVSATS